MGLLDFGKTESLIGLDIGASTIKLIEIDISGDPPRIVQFAQVETVPDCFSSNTLSRSDEVAELLSTLLESHSIHGKRVSIAMPGPSVFTKKIQMPSMSYAELASAVQFEAGNYIPHNVDDVKLDFHVIGEAGKNDLDILLVAVKNEVVDSFLDAISLAGLETAVVDVDYFAIQNAFELAYPERVDQTVALINIGARFSSVNICRNGESMFTGDVSVGGRLVSEDISEKLQIPYEEAEQRKLAYDVSSVGFEELKEVLDTNMEYVASELNRQLSFFWSAAGVDDGIDSVLLTGGGALLPGLVEELSVKTGIECELIDPLEGVLVGDKVDEDLIRKNAQLLAVAVGIGIRTPGDKIYPE